MSQFFNHRLMELAREAKGLSQERLANSVDITQATISRWEHGLFRPSSNELERLGEVLGVPVEFFSREDESLGGGLPVFYHRALASAPPRVTTRVNARCFIRAMQVGILASLMPDRPSDFPDLPADSFRGGAVQAAQALRAEWRIGPGPIGNLVRLLESKGGVVIVEDLGCAEVDALCWWGPRLPKIFFLNARKPWCRMRFSLAHEIGHTVMHTEPVDTAEAERQADDFAGEFLFPAKDAKAALYGRINTARLAALKPRWKISMQAIAKSAQRAEVITGTQLTEIMKELQWRGWRKQEPVDVPPEPPSVYGSMLRYPLESLGWTMNELARALYTTPRELATMLGNNLVPEPAEPDGDSEQPFLRLVQ